MNKVIILPQRFLESLDTLENEIHTSLLQDEKYRNSFKVLGLKEIIKQKLILGSYNLFYKISMSDGLVSSDDLKKYFVIDKNLKNFRLSISYTVFLDTLIKNNFISKVFYGNNFNKKISKFKALNLENLQIYHICNTPHTKSTIEDLKKKYKTDAKNSTINAPGKLNPFAKINSQLKTLSTTSFDFDETIIGVQQQFNLTPEQIYKGAVDILHINQGYFNISLTAQDRVYSTLTTIKKEFRNFLLIDRESTVEVDIPCSQPMLAFSLFTKSKDVFTDEELKEINELKNIFESDNEDFYNEFVYQIYVKLKGIKNYLNTDYKKDALTYFKHVDVRNYVKGYVMKTMYDTKTFKTDSQFNATLGFTKLKDLNVTPVKEGEPGYFEFIKNISELNAHHKRIFNIFNERFPNFLHFIIQSKVSKEQEVLHNKLKDVFKDKQDLKTYNFIQKSLYTDFNALWHHAQVLESKILSNAILLLSNEGMKPKYFTVHDSFVVKKSDKVFFQDALKKSILHSTGFVINID